MRQVLPCERASRRVHSPRQPGILAMKETAGGQRPPSALLTSAAMYFYHGVSFIYQYVCFSNNLVETMCQLNCLLIIRGTWAHQCFICNSLGMLIWRRRWHPLQPSCLENPMNGGAWWAAVHGVAKSWTRLSDFPFTFHFPALEKEMATHPSVLAWRIPGTGEPGGLPSMGSHRVGHD